MFSVFTEKTHAKVFFISERLLIVPKMFWIALIFACSLVSAEYLSVTTSPEYSFKHPISNGDFQGFKSEINFPKYEEHVITTLPYSYLKFVTETSTTTRTHTLRITSTSDVWVTSAVVVPLVVTQYKTQRSFVREEPNTVTSYIRVTLTPVIIETTTIEKHPVRTLVSLFTHFRTVTSTVDLLQPITHYDTSFEIVSLPIHETQTLVQVSYSTTTTRSTEVVTRTRQYGY